jgi:hypothetical protein
MPQGTDFEDIHLKMEKLIDWRRLLMSRKLTMVGLFVDVVFCF